MLKYTHYVAILSLLTVLISGCKSTGKETFQKKSENAKPNIKLIVADDMGW